jgi:hypothetical protein
MQTQHSGTGILRLLRGGVQYLVSQMGHEMNLNFGSFDTSVFLSMAALTGTKVTSFFFNVQNPKLCLFYPENLRKEPSCK